VKAWWRPTDKLHRALFLARGQAAIQVEDVKPHPVMKWWCSFLVTIPRTDEDVIEFAPQTELWPRDPE
jgi:hypothetical protein